MLDPWIVLGDFNTFHRFSERVRDGVEVGGHTNELARLFAETGLGDLHFSRSLLTWCNNQEGDSKTYAKLDRVIINKQWFLKFQNAHAVFLPQGISNHCPGIVYMPTQLAHKNFPFRYCNIWSSDSRFLDTVRAVWNTSI